MTSQKPDNKINSYKLSNTQLRNQLTELIKSIQIIFDHLSDHPKKMPNIQIPLPQINEQTLNEIKDLKKYRASISSLKDKIDLNYFCKENKKREKEIINKTSHLSQLIIEHQLLLTYIYPKPIDHSTLDDALVLMAKKKSDACLKHNTLKEESRKLFQKLNQQFNYIEKIETRCNMILKAIAIQKKKATSSSNNSTTDNINVNNNIDYYSHENRVKEIELKIKKEEGKYMSIIRSQLKQIDNNNRAIQEYYNVIRDYNNIIKSKEIEEIRSTSVISHYSKKNTMKINFTTHNNRYNQLLPQQKQPDKRKVLRNSSSSANLNTKPFIIGKLNAIPKQDNMICKSVMINKDWESNGSNGIGCNINKKFQSELINEIINLSKNID